MRLFSRFGLPLIFSVCCLLAFHSGVYGQKEASAPAKPGKKTLIKGRVTDAETNEALPFVNVYFKGTQIGTTTDFDGYYNLESETPTDSLTASYIGYATRSKWVLKGQAQTINFQLGTDATVLAEIVVKTKYENPAWEILRNVVANKSRNDKKSLSAYQYESYSKTEMDIDKITEKFRQKKAVQKILNVLDSMQKIVGEDGQPILPVFISESISDVYYIRDPARRRENILKTKVTGIGITDGTYISQLIGSSFQQYDFYENWLSILGKDFMSPIADGWRLAYEYDLTSWETKVGGEKCYRIDFKPKRPEDLAFTGSMWITHKHYALKQIDVKIDKTANLNFIEKIKIQQELTLASDSAWLPSKTRVLVDVGEIRDDWAGMLAKFYVSNKDFVINQPKPVRFFDEQVHVEEDAQVGNGDEYWQTARHDTLTKTEANLFQMIDTIRNLPVVRTYVDIAEVLVDGYKTVGKIDLGKYNQTYAFNDVEGHRFRVGFRTNTNFSRKWTLRGYGAYGTLDEMFKYKAEAEYIFSRRPWTVGGISRTHDVEQVAIFNDDVVNSPIFDIFVRYGQISRRRPFISQVNKIWFKTDIYPGVSTKLTLRNRDFDPVTGNNYGFAYQDPVNGELLTRFTTTEMVAEIRVAMGEKFIQDGNSRVSLGSDKRPALTLRYTRGVRNFLGSDLNYDKWFLGLEQRVRVGIAGYFEYKFHAGYIPSTVPYPLLETHLGNESMFFNSNSYNLMRFFEFVSDKYVSLRLQHRFEGFFFNRIPLLRRLKWREVATANLLYGGVSDANISIIPNDTNVINPGLNISGFKWLRETPYTEVSYGVENILKFIRVDFVHRLTYLHYSDQQIPPFGIRVSAQFRL